MAGIDAPVQGPTVLGPHPVTPAPRRARRAWQAVPAVLVAGAAATLVLTNRNELAPGWRAARHASPAWLLAALACELLWLTALGFLHGATRRVAGVTGPARRAVVPAAGAHAVNLVTKSGGVAGLAVFLRDARRRGLPRPQVVTGYLLAAVLADLAFAVALVTALAVVVADGRFRAPEAVAGVVFVVYLGVRLTLVAAAARSRVAVRRLQLVPGRLLARLRRRPMPTIETADLTSADEMYDAVALVRTRPAAIAPAAAIALLVEALGVAVLWCVLEAFGLRTGASVPFVAYAVSVLFGIVSVLPAGLGFVELSLGGVLASFGARAGVAGAVVVVYRLFELWVPLALGAVAAHQAGRGGHPGDRAAEPRPTGGGR